ncbi:MAG: hypothetical protein ABSF03_28895 [Streptosporangiaceae bacterium]|jgi:hypothetical protein
MIDATYRYDQCRCAARRVRQLSFQGHYAPEWLGWPELHDKHNRPVTDTGRRKEPAEGWPVDAMRENPRMKTSARPPR